MLLLQQESSLHLSGQADDLMTDGLALKDCYLNTMKKLISITLILFVFTGCSGVAPTEVDTAPVSLTATPEIVEDNEEESADPSKVEEEVEVENEDENEVQLSLASFTKRPSTSSSKATTESLFAFETPGFPTRKLR